ncbi:hypothetical protein [Sediminitomix flava]|uniref:Uncharacterized protein n=1 Tax=Sediminitomix flava TaxID=379075 RepID=A0A315ZED8_SEDFL|nr:hypothetical protein [Sediminitomix flava]PWJ43976.1 hypothetical protein BC781_101326 [Sediminitomix flava]
MYHFRRLLVFTLLSLLFINLTSAQKFTRDVWHEGEIDLNDGSTVKGLLKIDIEKESIQLKSKGTIRSFSAQNIQAFQIIDSRSKKLRSFYALPFYTPNGYGNPHLFELLTEGETSLLVRERIVEKIESNFDPYWGNMNSKQQYVREDDFYLLKPSSSIKMVDLRNREASLEHMKDQKEGLMAYIKQGKLKYYTRSDMIKIVNKYNQLKTVNKQASNQ